MSKKIFFVKVSRVFILSIVLFLFSCQYPQPVRKALMQSGKNKAELEKVLRHYSLKKEDSMHLKAAEFLIAGMPEHFSFKSKALSDYITETDSIYPNMSNIIKRVVYQIPIHEYTFFGTKILDIEVMKSDFLIAHIDNSIKMWKLCPWLKDITFEDFCEYLLPYRFAQDIMSAKI